MNPNTNLVFTKLNKAKKTGNGRWIACCPAHQDDNPSLSVRELDDGRILIHCFAGCETTDVLSALGLRFEDLFPESDFDGKTYFKPHLKQPFHAGDVLECVAFEILLCAVAALNLSQGISLTEEDNDRLLLAAARLQHALELSNGK